MQEQEYKLENIDSFELADIFECGQCFRWNKQEDGSYTGIFKRNVINVKKENCHQGTSLVASISPIFKFTASDTLNPLPYIIIKIVLYM